MLLHSLFKKWKMGLSSFRRVSSFKHCNLSPIYFLFSLSSSQSRMFGPGRTERGQRRKSALTKPSMPENMFNIACVFLQSCLRIQCIDIFVWFFFLFSYKLCPVTGQPRDTLRPALQHSALHKVRELEGKARVWDMSGGLHMSGTKRGNFFAFLKCPYLSRWSNQPLVQMSPFASVSSSYIYLLPPVHSLEKSFKSPWIQILLTPISLGAIQHIDPDPPQTDVRELPLATA